MSEEEVLKKLAEYGTAIRAMKSKIEELEKENAALKNAKSPLDSDEMIKAFAELDNLLEEKND